MLSNNIFANKIAVFQKFLNLCIFLVNTVTVNDPHGCTILCKSNASEMRKFCSLFTQTFQESNISTYTSKIKIMKNKISEKKRILNWNKMESICYLINS